MGPPHSRPDRCQQRPCTDDIHDARQIVGEHAERHLARNLRQRLHQEVRRAHPHLERAEGMLNRLAPAAHGLGILIQPLLHGFENVLMLPSRDAAIFACGALILECAGLAGVRPVAAPLLPVFLAGIVAFEPLARGAALAVAGAHSGSPRYQDGGDHPATGGRAQGRTISPSPSARPANVAGPSLSVTGAFNVESQPLAELHAEKIDACRLQRAEVQKYIRTARVVLDETEAAIGIPHFQSSGSHPISPWPSGPSPIIGPW